MSLVPYTRVEMTTVVSQVSSVAEEGGTLRIAWRNEDDEIWQNSTVAPYFTRNGLLQVRIVDGDDEGGRYSFPLRGVRYAAMTNLVQTIADTNLAQANNLHYAQRQLSGERRAHHQEASNDWRRIREREAEIQQQLNLATDSLNQKERAFSIQRQELVDRVQDEERNQHAQSLQLENQRYQFLQQKERLEEVMADQQSKEQERDEAQAALKIANDGNFEVREKLRRLQTTMVAQRDASNMKLAELEKTASLEINALRLEVAKQKSIIHRDAMTSPAQETSARKMGASTRGAMDAQNLRISELMTSVADLQRQLIVQKKPTQKPHTPRGSVTDASSSSDDEHIGATDEEDEQSCKSALSWWDKKERFLDFGDRATSAFLADCLTNDAFEEAWRRRLKLKTTSKEYLTPLVEDMMRRLRLGLRVVRLGAPSSVAAYAQRKALRDSIEAAARLELTVAGATAKDFEKFNASLRKARAKNRSRRNDFMSLDAVVADVRTGMKPSTPRGGGGRKWGGQKPMSTPRPQSPKPASH